MKYFLILILFCKFCSAKFCFVLLNSISKPGTQIELKLVKGDETFIIADPKSQGLGLSCTLFTDGSLFFSIRKIPKKDSIDIEVADWKASDAFDLAMEHFGDKVKRIVGNWSKEENLRIFLEEKAKGRTDEEAAFATWTGKQAWKHGFRKISSLDHIKGDKDYITVVFSKP